MNFLSHFYFDRTTADSYLVLGTVLPDLISNANKDWKIYPHKHPECFQDDSDSQAILKGWQRHLLVDKHFHSSAFFEKHTQELRKQLAPLLQGSVVRPSFLAHICLELLLDGLLITENLVEVEKFYQHLERSYREKIEQFLKLNKINEPNIFFRFFDQFLKSRYLNSYRDSRQITYALNRIAMRVWPEGLQHADQGKITDALMSYQTELKKDFMEIYQDIDQLLKQLPKL